jgi:chemotaxis protein MotB
VKPDDEETQPHELVIIRRRSGGEEGGHHGGVWKIAYADFMTAMMAFFLVMWLINSTDRKVLAQVANYFNPLRLTDKVPTPRGLHEMESGAQGKSNAFGNSTEADGKAKADLPSEAGKPKYTEQALFEDPFGALANLAAEAKTEAPRAGPSEKETRQGPGAPGDVQRDPFDPAYRREAPAAGPADVKPREPGKQADADPAKAPPGADKKASPAEKVAQEPAEAKALKETEAQAALEAAAKLAEEAARKAAQEQAAKAEAAQIEMEITKALQFDTPGTLPHIDVTVTEEGTLISLTDDYDFGMFAVASAEPRPAMVVVMEKIAKVLVNHPQKLVVRGHTDGRPYRSGTYDNWRLSTARAHMAYYMLLRGGVEEKRFDKIEGYADRVLRVPQDPEAARNRRIEILLRKRQP